MGRILVVACVVACAVAPTWAQAPPAPSPATAAAKAPATKTAAKKQQLPKASISAKPPAAVETGPCQLGVIPALGVKFVVQKIGITVFGNEYTEIPIDWGLDDIAFARVRAAASGTAVRRLGYAKGAFETYYHPQAQLFRNSRNDLTAIVRQIAGNANCERYAVITTFEAQYGGTNQTLNGIGILDGSGPFGHPTLFTYVDVMIFDGKTFEIRRNPNANLGSALAKAFTSEKPNPLSQLADADFPKPATEAAHNAMLRDHVRTLLAEKLDKTLPDYFQPQ